MSGAAEGVHGWAVPEAGPVIAGLGARGWSIATAESLTGGLVVAALVAIPGASARVRGGVVSYATDLKARLLGVDEGLLARRGAVHPDVAVQMAEGVREALGDDGGLADVGVSTTGVAGPDPADGQPVGTVHVAVATPSGTRVESLLLAGTRDDVRVESVRAALRLVLASL